MAQDEPGTTWTIGGCVTFADTVTLASIDPAAPSAMIAEMMTVRPMDMFPPCLLPRSAARCMAPAARTAHLINMGSLPIFGNFVHLG
jgi:hypothetical protein